MSRRLLSSVEGWAPGPKQTLSQSVQIIRNQADFERYCGREFIANLPGGLASGVTLTAAGILAPIIAKKLGQTAASAIITGPVAGFVTALGVIQTVDQCLDAYVLFEMMDAVKEGKQVQVITRIVKYDTGTSHGYTIEPESFIWVQ